MGEPEHHGRPRVDPCTGRNLPVVVYEPGGQTDDRPPAEPTDEPKPKRRPAWRHALGGLALLVCLGASVWMLERSEWTDWGGWWRRTRTQFSGGPRGVRDQVQLGMTQTEVRMRIGRGQELVRKGFTLEDYTECGFGVEYDMTRVGDDWEMVATRIYDIPRGGFPAGYDR